MQTRLMAQNNVKWPISLLYVSNPLASVITVNCSNYQRKNNEGWDCEVLIINYAPNFLLFAQAKSCGSKLQLCYLCVFITQCPFSVSFDTKFLCCPVTIVSFETKPLVRTLEQMFAGHRVHRVVIDLNKFFFFFFNPRGFIMKRLISATS